ncbi:unnamed protein product [Schistosoma curassoni]|uniref:Transposase n=1 Tax=Schistosoma curassoni TaxID=6186 RepID=A0A183KY52_9TREM|nr:unnamed protein product [Schistosoma curassoni]
MVRQSTIHFLMAAGYIHRKQSNKYLPREHLVQS